MKKRLKKLTGLLSFAVLGIFAWYLVANFQSFKGLLSIGPQFGIVLIILNILRIYNNGSFLKYSLEFYDKPIGYIESFYIALLTSIGNFFGPFMGGAGVRAIYLKQKHKLSYTDFAATLSGFYLITFIVNSGAGLLALIAIQIQTGLWSPIVYFAFAGWLLFSIILAKIRSLNSFVAWVRPRSQILVSFLDYINNTVKGWQSIQRDKKLFYRLNRITVYGFLMLYAVTYVEFRAVNVHASIASISLYVALSALSLLVSLTPGAIGIREAMFIFTGKLIGLNTDQILAIAVIDRAATFIVLALGYVVLKLMKRVRLTETTN